MDRSPSAESCVTSLAVQLSVVIKKASSGKVKKRAQGVLYRTFQVFRQLLNDNPAKINNT